MVPFPAEIAVEVAYAEPGRAVVKTYRLGLPACVRDALDLAGRDPEFAGIDVVHASVGIFGAATDPGRLLADGDRIEIYRPLAADPKSARRARARRDHLRKGAPRPR